MECEYDFRTTSSLSTAYVLSILPEHISRLACDRAEVGLTTPTLYDEVRHDASSG